MTSKEMQGSADESNKKKGKLLGGLFGRRK